MKSLSDRNTGVVLSLVGVAVLCLQRGWVPSVGGAIVLTVGLALVVFS